MASAIFMKLSAGHPGLAIRTEFPINRNSCFLGLKFMDSPHPFAQPVGLHGPEIGRMTFFGGFPMGRTMRPTTFIHSVVGIIFGGSHKKVIRVNAESVIASMANELPRRYLAMQGEPHGPVSSVMLAVYVNCSIPGRGVNGFLPLPAPFGGDDVMIQSG
jgi:hypothetical protein